MAPFASCFNSTFNDQFAVKLGQVIHVNSTKPQTKLNLKQVIKLNLVLNLFASFIKYSDPSLTKNFLGI